MLDARSFSPMRRPRLFWGNIPGLHSGADDIAAEQHSLQEVGLFKQQEILFAPNMPATQFISVQLHWLLFSRIVRKEKMLSNSYTPLGCFSLKALHWQCLFLPFSRKYRIIYHKAALRGAMENVTILTEFKKRVLKVKYLLFFPYSLKMNKSISGLYCAQIFTLQQLIVIAS